MPTKRGCLSIQRITGLSSVQTLTVPAGTAYALLTANVQNVRYLTDGTDPTTTRGHLILCDAPQPTRIDSADELADAKFIEVLASASLDVSCYGVGET